MGLGFASAAGLQLALILLREWGSDPAVTRPIHLFGTAAAFEASSPLR